MVLFKSVNCVNLQWQNVLQLCYKCRRLYSTFYVTTPIFYVNAPPHLGHLYSAVLADAAYRFHRLLTPDRDAFLSTGTDEHGLKIEKAADSKNIPTDVYCERISAEYKRLFDLCDIEYTRFIRTTEKEHARSVQHFWNVLKSRDLIYAGKYSGWYSVPDETYLSTNLTEEIRKDDGSTVRISTESGHPVEWIEENNYMFKLSSFVPDLLHWLSDERRVVPSKFHKQLKDWLTNEEKITADLSISRPSDRIHWGIPVPGDEGQQIVYVWLDALVNYLTAVGYPDKMDVWPASVHVCGKDILKFHGIYWPAFLIGAGLEPPEQLLVHSHWTVNNEKMSKSRNNVIDPFEKVALYSSSGLRYFLLREGVAHSNGNYVESSVKHLLNAELANTLGNLLNRCTGTVLNPHQVFPALRRPNFYLHVRNSGTLESLTDKLSRLGDQVSQHYATFDYYKGVDLVVTVLRLVNKYFEESKPWTLKTGADEENLKCILHVTMETLRICGIALQPIIPDISERLLNKLAVRRERRLWADMKPSWEYLNSSTVQESAANDLPLSEEKITLYSKI